MQAFRSHKLLVKLFWKHAEVLK